MVNLKWYCSKLIFCISHKEIFWESGQGLTSWVSLVAYVCIHVNVQKLVSYHKHKNYVVSTKSVLMRMIVMKIWYFHGHTGMLTEQMRHQNLFISYGDTFMKQAKLCTMYLNLSAQKSLESRNQD